LNFLGGVWVLIKIKVFLPVHDQLGWHASVSGFPGANFFGTILPALTPHGLKIFQTVRQRQGKTY
jgi:hypothetical protein